MSSSVSGAAPEGRWSSLDLATKLVRDVPAGWVLGLYPDAGEASGTFQYRVRPERCGTPGPALDPDRSLSEAARRARTRVRRYVVANRLDRLATLTYAGEGLHDERRLRQHVAHFFKRLRYEVVGEVFPYLWVPEWHKTSHGLHVHFAVDRFIDQRAIASTWGRGYVDIRKLGDGGGSLASARRAAGYLAKYVGKAMDDGRRTHRLHRYERAQGFEPKVERIVAASRSEALALASERMGGVPSRVWTSDDADGWQGPPAVWVGWDD